MIHTTKGLLGNKVLMVVRPSAQYRVEHSYQLALFANHVANLTGLGQRIAQARKERQYSQRVFADMLGIAPATLVALERGAPTVQIGHYARGLWMLEIQDAALGGFGVSSP